MELRSASRRKWTFTLRLLFALAGVGACLVVLMLPRLGAREKGRTMLVILSYLSLGFCLTVGGFLTADCVSSEKREGTLGLLFLTPLRGIDIVLGKMVCHGMQVLYGLCAMFPVFFLPLLAGFGVVAGRIGRRIGVGVCDGSPTGHARYSLLDRGDCGSANGLLAGLGDFFAHACCVKRFPTTVTRVHGLCRL
jgi:hypothetical protein